MAKEWTSDRRLYLDKEGKVVEHTDPNKSELLVAEGGKLSMDDAVKYGLVKGEDQAASETADEPVAEGEEAESQEEAENDDGSAKPRARKTTAKAPAKHK